MNCFLKDRPPVVQEAVKLVRAGPDKADQVPADRDSQDKVRGDAVAPGRGLPTEVGLGKPARTLKPVRTSAALRPPLRADFVDIRKLPRTSEF